MKARANKKNIRMLTGDCSINCIREMLWLTRKMYAENIKHANNISTSAIPNKYLNDGILFIN
jgi:hypothetical protein